MDTITTGTRGRKRGLAGRGRTGRGLVKDHILLSKDNVVFTPHIAFYSDEALKRILDATVKNIEAFFEGNPQNAITQGAR